MDDKKYMILFLVIMLMLFIMLVYDMLVYLKIEDMLSDVMTTAK